MLSVEITATGMYKSRAYPSCAESKMNVAEMVGRHNCLD